MREIVCVDFDKCLFNTKGMEIISLNVYMKELIDLHREMNNSIIILWTCRCGRVLRDALKVCEDNGIWFDYVNENCKEIREMYEGEEGRKVYADVYYDDKACKVIA